jgi:N-acetyl-anhydromuramyl-L-alanine amidase AmpD
MFAAGGAPKRSAHYVVDASEIVQCVRDSDTAYAAPGANDDGLQVEICGWARWTAAEWQASGVLPRVAGLVRQLCAAHGLPRVRVDVAGLLTGARGVTTHADVATAFSLSTHHDPGAGFPLALVLNG